MSVQGLPNGRGAWGFNKTFDDILKTIQNKWGVTDYYKYKIVEADQVERTVQELIDLGIPKHCIEVV
jgi:hypothetical protein